jgi:uncharacterized protein (DUF2267 family)
VLLRSLNGHCLARRTSARGLSGAKPTVTGPLMTGNGLFGPMRPKSIDLTRMAVSGLGLRDGEQLQPKHVKVTVKHGGGSIMIWSALTYAGTGWMCKIDGNMDKTLYKETLQDVQDRTINFAAEELNLRRDQMVFQHDNDPKHTSNLVQEYLKNQEYQVLEWPPQSPDLNPIENMWRLLKIRLNEYDTPPKGMQELYERVTKVWYDVIDKEECRNVIHSMPRRIEQCIRRKGHWTDY